MSAEGQRKEPSSVSATIDSTSDRSPVIRDCPPITISVAMKFVTMMALVFAAANYFQSTLVPCLFAAAIVGLFLSDHFARTKGREFLLLLVLPCVLFTVLVFLSLIPNLHLPEERSIEAWVDVAPRLAGAMIGMVAFSIPAICVALMAVILATSMIHRCTGIRMVGSYSIHHSGRQSKPPGGDVSANARPFHHS